MKFSLSLLACLICIIQTNAQIKKKSVLLGGQVLFYNSDIDSPNSQPNQTAKNAILNLSIGRAFRDNSVFGLNISYGTSVQKNYYTGSNFISYDVKQYNIGVFNRRYRKLATDFYFFGEFGGAFASFKQVNTDTLGKILDIYRQTGGEMSLTPGISYQILRKVQLEIMIPRILSIQYAATKHNEPIVGTTTQKQFWFSTSLKSSSLSFLGVGFNIIL